jgi:ribonuclease D
MTPLPACGARVTLVCEEGDLERLAERTRRASRLALDVEANGLFAYQASLCVLQLAWEEEGRIVVAVIDANAVSIDPLRPIVGPDGPVKVLHDLSFDARLLEESGVPLGRVHDTSVAARLLGFMATGLSTLLASELGVTIDKRLQQHDWSRRPLTEDQIAYLAEDVRHLLRLDDHLARKAEALGISAEIEEECAYRLAGARCVARDRRPGYARIKGAAKLEPIGRAVLRRLTEARDAAARGRDVPPFKVVSNEVLLEIARLRPTTLPAIAAIRGATSFRTGLHAEDFLRAVEAGILDGDVPSEHARFFQPLRSPSRPAIAARRALESRISAFRKAEAKRRGVDVQAVLPGHCAQDLAELLLSHTPHDPVLRDAIAQIPGLGAQRRARYTEAFLAIARDAARGLSADPCTSTSGHDMPPEDDEPAA